MLPSMLVATLLNSAPAEIDGRIDPSYGDDGRTLIGYLESDTPTLRGYALSASGRTWMLADDDRDFGTLYLARLLADGTPDSTFGPAMNGQRRVALPAGLIANTQALRLTGSTIQPDGKPVLWGGLDGSRQKERCSSVQGWAWPLAFASNLRSCGVGPLASAYH